MNLEGSPGHGSMFGVVDSMSNLAKAMEDLLRFLPADFVWPTIVKVSPFSIYIEWSARDDTTEYTREAVWIIANPDDITMNDRFGSGQPTRETFEFDPQLAAEWLKQLTKNWKWTAEQGEDGISGSSLQRSSMGG